MEEPASVQRRFASSGTLSSLAFLMMVTGACWAHSDTASPLPMPDVSWRQVGPFRAGWATAVTGVSGDPLTFYFGGAGGGVWKTTDAGRTWRASLQAERASSIGALAVAPSDARVLYAGTGQATTRFDIMSGEGVYRSDDAGTTWRPVGLSNTAHIGDLLVHPRDPNRVIVAALGHVFGPGPERGVYLTRDGGRTWRRTLATPDSVGAVDLAWDPLQPSVVYAATWQIRMHPWLDYFMPMGGRGSAVWKSTDGGESWRRLAGGLPEGQVGRIGVAVPRGSAGRTVYALVQVYSATGAAGRPAGSGLYRSDDAGDSWRLVNPDGSLASGYFGRLWVSPRDPRRIWLSGQSLRESRDAGATFVVARGSPGGDDYHALWVDPADDRRLITGADQGAAVSLNGGESWSSWYNQPTGQFYHLAADDRFPYHIYSGQQDNGTVAIASRGAYGVIEERDWHPVGGDERDYMVPKPGDPRTVFGSGLGGGVSRFDAETRQSANVSAWPLSTYGADPTKVKYRYTWITPLVLSPLPPHAMYLGAQCLFRSLDDGRHWDVVSPDLSGREEGAGPCADPALDQARRCGYGVIYSIAPSPLDSAVVWVGTDDGLVKKTRDGGASWRDVTPPGLPAWGTIASVDLSPLDPAVAYIAVDTHRLDRFAPLAYATDDGGERWREIGHGLPADEFVSVVRCDRRTPGLLYAGTNRSVYVSFDDGERWQPLANGFPTTWVRDLLAHGDDLLAATQGRAIWSFDDVTPLRGIASGATLEPVHLFAPAPAVRMRASENRDTPPPPETPLGENPPTGAVLDYWLAPGTEGPVTLTVEDAAGRIVRRFRSDAKPESLGARAYFEQDWIGTASRPPAGPGMHRFVWNLQFPRPAVRSFRYSIAAVRTRGTPILPGGAFVLPGRYRVTLEAGGRRVSQPLEVRLDPRLSVPMAGLEEQLALSRSLDSTLQEVWSAHDLILRTLNEAGDAIDPATADSLRAIAGRGEASLSGMAGSLGSLFTTVQSADSEPTQGAKDAWRACRRRIDGLLERWHRIASGLTPRTRSIPSP
ncbi:MAG: hypothetical protein IT347_01315 [Candidatus Eisenbacteria bacterium]|nr:hypothetical protein [Candidatus Eisenbacteria bacterium]